MSIVNIQIKLYFIYIRIVFKCLKKIFTADFLNFNCKVDTNEEIKILYEFGAQLETVKIFRKVVDMRITL